MGQEPQPHKSGPRADARCDFILPQPTFSFALGSGRGLGFLGGHLLRVTVHWTSDTQRWLGQGKLSHSSTAVPPIPASHSHSFQQLSLTLEPLIPSIQTTLGQRIKWLSLGVQPSALPRWQLQKMQSSVIVVWSKSHSDHILFSKPYRKRKSSWHYKSNTLGSEGKKRQTKNKLTSIKCSLPNTPKHSMFSYITIKKLQCPVQTTLQGKLMVYVWRMEWTNRSLLSYTLSTTNWQVEICEHHSPSATCSLAIPSLSTVKMRAAPWSEMPHGFGWALRVKGSHWPSAKRFETALTAASRCPNESGAKKGSFCGKWDLNFGYGWLAHHS